MRYWLIAVLGLCACHAPVPARAPTSEVRFAYRDSDSFGMHNQAERMFCTLMPRAQQFELSSRLRDAEKVPVEQFFPGFEALVMEPTSINGTEVILGGRDRDTGWMRVIQINLESANDDDLAKYVTADRVFLGLHPPQALNPWAEGPERTWMIESTTGSVHLLNLRTGEHQQVAVDSDRAIMRQCTFIYLRSVKSMVEEIAQERVMIIATTEASMENLNYPGHGPTVYMLGAYETTVSE